MDFLNSNSSLSEIRFFLKSMSKNDLIAIGTLVNQYEGYNLVLYGSKENLLMILKKVDRDTLLDCIKEIAPQYFECEDPEENEDDEGEEEDEECCEDEEEIEEDEES